MIGMGKNPLSSTQDFPTIRPALADDAGAIYAIKLEAFRDSFLPYTIYQSPLSVHYLEELIAQQATSAHSFFVIGQEDRTLGYYYAVIHCTTFFLNYIAVAASARGQGLGHALLSHYETMGQDYGCQQLALDVFESNPRARDWYLDHGYNPQSVSLYVRFATKSLTGHEPLSLQWNDDAWAQAMQEENTRGFSKVDCLCGSGHLTLGLIAGRVCKLLDYKQVSLEHALFAVGSRFHQTREILVVSVRSDELDGLPMLDCEKSLRLVKIIRKCS